MAFKRVASSVYQNWFFSMFPNWEEIVDPNNPLHQIAIHSAIHEMAQVTSDRAARQAIQTAARKAIASAAEKVGK
jgi:hypothetical protein